MGVACSPQATPQPDAPLSETAPPVYGGVFRIAIHAPLASFDIATENGAHHLTVAGLVQNGLLKWENIPILDQTRVMCDLCESWRQVNETAYEFKLRPGVRWHDTPPLSGREFVAADYKYTLERILNRGFKNNRAFDRHVEKVAGIKGVEAPDRQTLRVELREPQASALLNLGDPFLLAVAREQVEAEPDGVLRQTLVGTGPFLLKESAQSESYTLGRNPDFFQKGLPYFDGVEVRVIPDKATRLNAFRAGEIHDPGALMTEENRQTIDRQHPQLAMVRVPGHATAAFVLNNSRRPFDDGRVRRAMYLAFDRQGLIDANRSGEAQLVRWVATPAKGVYATSEEDLKQMPGFRHPKEEDIAEARELLAEAGFPQGFEVVMTVAKGGVLRANAEVFAEQMSRSLDIQIGLRLVDAPRHREATQVGSFNLSADLQGASIDPGRALAPLYSRHTENTSRYSSPAFDELFDRQARALDVEERRRHLFQIYELLDRDVPIIPAYADYNYRGYPRKCHGIPEEPRYNALIRYLAEAWCEPGVLK